MKLATLHSVEQDDLLKRSMSGEDGIYQNKCVICDKLFLAKGKRIYTCEHCRRVYD